MSKKHDSGKKIATAKNKETWGEVFLVLIPIATLLILFGLGGLFYNSDWGSKFDNYLSKSNTDELDNADKRLTRSFPPLFERNNSQPKAVESKEDVRQHKTTEIIGIWSADSASMGGAVATMNFFADQRFVVSRMYDAKTVVVTHSGEGNWKNEADHIVVEYNQIGVSSFTDGSPSIPPTTSFHRDKYEFVSKNIIRNHNGHVFRRLN